MGDDWRAYKEFIKELKKSQPTLTSRIKPFVEKNNLILQEFANGHHRVINPDSNRSFDYWETGTIKKPNGQYEQFSYSLLKKLINLIKTGKI